MVGELGHVLLFILLHRQLLLSRAYFYVRISRLQDKLVKRRNLTKQPTMPELSEVIGSQENQQEHSSTDKMANQQEAVKVAFPSLSDVFLEKMKLLPGRKDKLKRLVSSSLSLSLSASLRGVYPYLYMLP